MTVAMTTSTTEKSKAEKDLVTRLADAGEEALQRLADLPGGQKALTAVHDLRTRVDELSEEGARDRRARGARGEAREGGRRAEEGEDAGPATARASQLIEGQASANADAGREVPERRSRAAPARVTGTRSRSARGTISNRAGVVPGCSPSSSIGSGSSASMVTTLPRRSSRRGCGRCLPL